MASSRFVFDPLNPVKPLPSSVLCTCEVCGLQFWECRSRTQRHCSRACIRNRAASPEWFWSKVEKDGPVLGALTPCWIWASNRIKTGYGVFQIGYAHRRAFEITNGPIPPGLNVLHKCDNPPCVNPSHLFLGTKLDNAMDMVSKGRQAAGHRHPLAKLTPDDVLKVREIWGRGGIKQSEIAELFGVQQMTISRVVRRKTYFNVA